MVTIERNNNEIIIKCFDKDFNDEWKSDEILARRIAGLYNLIKESGYISNTQIRAQGDYGTNNIAIELKELIQEKNY